MKRLRLLGFEFLLILIISTPAFFAALNNQYFEGHDPQHVVRLHLLFEGLKQGQVYPRWVDGLGFGFGYPLFNFYPPLIYYLGAAFHFIGFSLIASIKLVMIAGFILGAWGMYILAKEIIGKAAALLSAVLYTYFTYHAVLLYVRGALAEFFGYALLPLVFLAFYRLKSYPTTRNSIYFGILFAMLILTHPLVAIPTTLFLGLFYLFYLVKHSIKGCLTGLALSAFFWLPSLFEKKYTLVDKILTGELADYKLHFIYPQQFWYSPWGWGGSTAGLTDGMTFQLGKIPIIIALVSFILSFVYLRFVKTERLKHFYFFVAMLLFSIFMTTSFSSFLWQLIPPLSYLQFPWRFLTFTAVFISLVGGFSLYFVYHIWERLNTKTILTISALGISVVIIWQYQKYFQPQQFIQTTDAEKTSYQEIAWHISRTSYEFVPKEVATTKTELGTTVVDIKKEKLPRSPYEIISGSADVKIVKNNFNEKIFEVSSKTPIEFRLNTYNFPGWRAYTQSRNGIPRVTRKEPVSDSNPYHLITVEIPQGEYNLTFYFENTPVRTFGNSISLITLIFVILYFAKRKFDRFTDR